jgi:hypothetical protein
LLALVLAGCGGTRTVVRTVTVTQPLGGAAQLSFYGRIVSAQPASGGYFLRFDPAWWLSGVTANVAMAQALNVKCAPRACEAVPNDYYILDDGHEVLTFVLPRSTHGTVLTRPLKFPGTRIGADRLVQLVGRPQGLFEPLDSGVWLRVRGDTVLAFAQQYRP